MILFPGLPKRNPGLELANAFSVIHFLIKASQGCSNTSTPGGLPARGPRTGLEVANAFSVLWPRIHDNGVHDNNKQKRLSLARPRCRRGLACNHLHLDSENAVRPARDGAECRGISC